MNKYKQYLDQCKIAKKYPFDFFGSNPFDSIEVGQEYTLNEREVKATEVLGPKRTQAARASGKVNMIQAASGGSDKEKFMEINGLQGELLYAKMFNLYPGEQLEIRPRASKDDFGDIEHDDLIIDIKTTEYHTGRLTLSHWKQAEHIDALCLFTGKNGRFTFRGFYWAKELAKEENFRCLPGRDKPQYIMDQRNLLSFDALKNRTPQQPPAVIQSATSITDFDYLQ